MEASDVTPAPPYAALLAAHTRVGTLGNVAYLFISTTYIYTNNVILLLLIL